MRKTTDDLKNSLPAPIPNEPPEVRQDIADELNDHLECLRNQELLRDGSLSDEQIEQRVIERFGDPGQLAAQLRRARLKGPIMREKFRTIAIAVALLLSCVAVWRVVFHSPDALRSDVNELRASVHSVRMQLSRTSHQLDSRLSELTAQHNPPSEDSAGTMGGYSDGMGMEGMGGYGGDMGMDMASDSYREVVGYEGAGGGAMMGGMSGMGMGMGMSASMPGAGSVPPRRPAAEKLGDLLSQIYPESDVQLHELNADSILIRGSVLTSEHSEQMREIASEFFSRVLNHTTVLGSTSTPVSQAPAGSEASGNQSAQPTESER